MSRRYEPWPDQVVEGIAEVLGATDSGLTGTEIGTLLARCGIADVAPTTTKRYRLRDALLARQLKDNASNCVIRFITVAMEPVRYRETPALFTFRKDALDEVLVFIGLRVNEEGKVQRGVKAITLTEAAQHANSLRAELRRRGVHAEVLRYCSREVLERNAFHAALEASKSIPDRLRNLTGLHGDGAALIDASLSIGSTGRPRVQINKLSSDSERDEQTGFATLIKGLLGMFRNPVAHDPRMSRTVTDDELLELLMLVSMVHRRLDGAVVWP
ncbi:MAG: TIGR02391 family protein [Actinomycetota bacterium]